MNNVLPDKKPPTPELDYCPSSGRYGLVSKTSGEIVVLPCGRYSCPYCGPRKAYKLQKALELKFGTFDYVRLFTFTFRTTVFANPQHAINNASEIWRRFINNIRRDKSLSKSVRNFQYVRVVEFTKRDYPHYHVLADRYIPIKILSKHWNHAINIVMWSSGYNGTVNAIGMKTAKGGAKYATKYLMKTASEFETKLSKYFGGKRNKLKLYTKSGDMKLFWPSSSLDSWEFIILADSHSEGALIYIDNAQHPGKNHAKPKIRPKPPDKLRHLPQANKRRFSKYPKKEVKSNKNLFCHTLGE